MHISHKNNVLYTYHEVEWQCRLKAKGISKSEYWTWMDSITSGEPPVVDYSGETGYTMVNVTDEDVQSRVNQLSEYTARDVFNIKWSDSKEYFVMTTDEDGNSVKVVESVEKDEDPDSDTFGDVIKTNYKMSHFEGDDTAKDARLLAEKWEEIRVQRNILIAKTDYLALSDQTLSAKMTTYRQDLRDVPTQSDPNDIDWPVKPS